jgi:hypothetical protein
VTSLKLSDLRGNAFSVYQFHGLRTRMMADESRRDELMAYLGPTANKVTGLIRHQVKAVLHRRNKLPKVCTGVVQLWNDKVSDRFVLPNSP